MYYWTHLMWFLNWANLFITVCKPNYIELPIFQFRICLWWNVGYYWKYATKYIIAVFHISFIISLPFLICLNSNEKACVKDKCDLYQCKACSNSNTCTFQERTTTKILIIFIDLICFLPDFIKQWLMLVIGNNLICMYYCRYIVLQSEKHIFRLSSHAWLHSRWSEQWLKNLLQPRMHA